MTYSTGNSERDTRLRRAIAETIACNEPMTLEQVAAHLPKDFDLEADELSGMLDAMAHDNDAPDEPPPQVERVAPHAALMIAETPEGHPFAQPETQENFADATRSGSRRAARLMGPTRAPAARNPARGARGEQWWSSPHRTDSARRGSTSTSHARTRSALGASSPLSIYRMAERRAAIHAKSNLVRDHLAIRTREATPAHRARRPAASEARRQVRARH